MWVNKSLNQPGPRNAEIHTGSVAAETVRPESHRNPGRRPAADVTPLVDSSRCRVQLKSSESPRLVGLRILIIEDMADARTLFHRIMSREGADIRTAASVDEAREQLASFRPEIILSDIGLPGEDGLSFIRAFRQQEARDEHTPAVALTAYSHLRQPVLAAGFDLFLTKPTTGHELVLGILHALEMLKPH